MTQEQVSPLRARMIEVMGIEGRGESAQKAHIRAVRYFAEFLGRSPDTATEEDLQAYQLHMVNTNVTPSTYKVRLVGLRFFFETTCKRPEIKGGMHFRTEPRKLPVVPTYHFQWKDDVKEFHNILKHTFMCNKPVAKGLLDVEDAAALKKADVEGIQVSIHGARQLETAPTPVEVLPRTNVALEMKGRNPRRADILDRKSVAMRRTVDTKNERPE